MWYLLRSTRIYMSMLQKHYPHATILFPWLFSESLKVPQTSENIVAALSLRSEKEFKSSERNTKGIMYDLDSNSVTVQILLQMLLEWHQPYPSQVQKKRIVILMNFPGHHCGLKSRFWLFLYTFFFSTWHNTKTPAVLNCDSGSIQPIGVVQ